MTVTGDGRLGQESFDCEELAEEARSIALTGMTKAQAAAADKAYHDRISSGAESGNRFGPAYSAHNGEWCAFLPGGHMVIKSKHAIKDAVIVGPISEAAS